MNIWVIIAAVIYFLIQSGKITFGEGAAAGLDPQTLLKFAPWVLLGVLCFSPPMREKFFTWIDGILKPKV